MSSEFQTASKELKGANKQKICEERIQRAEFVKDDPELFIDSLNSSNFPEMLTHYSIDELSEMELFLVRGMHVGFALKTRADGGKEIVAVHNNEPGVKRIGRLLMQQAINFGGTHLDHFGTFQLNSLYESMGFEVYNTEEYDPQYDPDQSFIEKHGPVPVIYRRLKNNGR